MVLRHIERGTQTQRGVYRQTHKVVHRGTQTQIGVQRNRHKQTEVDRHIHRRTNAETGRYTDA